MPTKKKVKWKSIIFRVPEPIWQDVEILSQIPRFSGRADFFISCAIQDYITKMLHSGGLTGREVANRRKKARIKIKTHLRKRLREIAAEGGAA